MRRAEGIKKKREAAAAGQYLESLKYKDLSRQALPGGAFGAASAESSH
jgi:hypothetical protein